MVVAQQDVFAILNRTQKSEEKKTVFRTFKAVAKNFKIS